MTTNVDITNRALAQIGTKSQITSMTDGSQEAAYANLLYVPLRDFLLRQEDYDFAIQSASPSDLGGFAAAPSVPYIGFPYALAYPVAGVRIRQIQPAVINALNPRPMNWTIFFSNATNLKYIGMSELPSAVLYTTNTTPENAWDSIFTEAMVRMLGAALAFAVENRMEASKEKLREALAFAGVADQRTDV